MADLTGIRVINVSGDTQEVIPEAARVLRPGALTPGASRCCEPDELATCCEPAATEDCCATPTAEGPAPSCGCRA